MMDDAAHAEPGSGFTLRTGAAACVFLALSYALAASLLGLGAPCPPLQGTDLRPGGSS